MPPVLGGERKQRDQLFVGTTPNVLVRESKFSRELSVRPWKCLPSVVNKLEVYFYCLRDHAVFVDERCGGFTAVGIYKGERVGRALVATMQPDAFGLTITGVNEPYHRS